MELEQLASSDSRDSNVTNPPKSNLFRRDTTSIPGPLWNTPEFYIYYFIFLIVVPYMMYGAVQLSSDQLPNYQDYEYKLKEGWMFGRKFDDSDHQYSQFRNNIPILSLVALGYLILSKILHTIGPKTNESIPKFWTNFTPLKSYFIIVFNLIFLSVLHGTSILKISAICLVNFYLVKIMGKFKWSPLVSFLFNFCMLILADYYKGFKFGSFSTSLSYLDSYTGMQERWYIHFNLTSLRLVSWSFDYHWSLISLDKLDDYKTELNSNKLRANQNSPLQSFNLVNYFAYTLYAPLYLAGPIITFNDWFHQVKNGNKNISKSMLIKRGLNLLFCGLLMEWMLHYIYVMAISKTSAYQDFSPFQLTMVGFFNLKFIWLKLLVMWRFFRFWSLLDGIEPIENMGRCMSNNYSIQGFWQGWHCSYNRWLVRYIYIPLGGAKYSYLNIWAIFTFVAIWHDTSFQLLAWGWLISLFFIPELLAVQLTKPLRRKKYYRHLKAAGGALNVFALCTANLVGFALGTKGIQKLIGMLLTFDGFLFLLITYACLFVGVQVMIEIRNSELRAYHRNKLRNSD